MKKKILLTSSLIGLLLVYFVFNRSDENEIKVKKHEAFLANSPFAKSKNLTKKERKELGLPPNAYNEQLWELTMDPELGYPTPEKSYEIMIQQMNNSNSPETSVGGLSSSPWVNRGPNNQGGRTRALLFDPNDTTNKRVFAGGISGGLWVNNDITDEDSSWTQISGFPGGLSVSCIISDPNNSNTFYIGSGESYTSGDAVGNGLWKSTDAGNNWTHILGGATGSYGFRGQSIDGIFYINDLVARDNGGSTELYAAIANAFFKDSNGNPNQWHSLLEAGFYKSTDEGTTWNRLTGSMFQESNGSFSNPNDIELDINNNIWFTTTRSSFGFSGGKIISSTDGITFTLVTTIPNASRTEIEPSSSDANKFWIAFNNSDGEADLRVTTDAFTTVTSLNEPNDADRGIPANDFTRGQAFYDLEIEADGNDNLYVGGIDLFRSTDGGTTWDQISKWSNNRNLNTLNVSFVHADQHKITFKPDDHNKAVFGTDGGIFYCTDLANASTSSTFIEVNKDYNTVQYYYGDISESINGAGLDLIGGTQDNGTQGVFNAPNSGANSYFDPTGGDGGFTEIDDDYIITTYPFNNHFILKSPYRGFPVDANFYSISTGDGGSFINQAALDKNLDILYSNRTGDAIERTSDFTANSLLINNTTLTNTLLDSDTSAFKVSPFTTASSTLLVGLINGKVLKVENANASPTWSQINSGAGMTGSISDIEFGQNENEIFVTLFNYNTVNIWHTSDGGTTWKNIEGNFPDIPVYSILQNPLIPEELIIGTQFGVWATADHTATSVEWIPSQSGMDNVRVVDLDLQASDNTILASTHGRGFFTANFTSVPLSLREFDTHSLQAKIYPNPANEFINVSLQDSSTKGANYEIFNLQGGKVLSGALNNKPISLNSISNGIYFIKLNSENKTNTFKFIKK